MTRPSLCCDCGIRPVAYNGREHCYSCKPPSWGRPIPPCRRCGSVSDYFASGLCRRCHRSGGWISSCLDCLAWGVTQRNGWRCEACRGWFKRFGDAQQACGCCQRMVVVNQRGYCRLCCRQVTFMRLPNQSLNIATANRAGQQLFLADMLRQKHDRLRYAQALRAAINTRPCRVPPLSYPVSWRQLLLFDAEDTLRDYAAGRVNGFPDPPLPDLAADLRQALLDHAAGHGWRDHLIMRVDLAIRVLLGTQHTPGAAITVSQITALARGLGHRGARSICEVLAAAGMLTDDRPPPLHHWFTSRSQGLPEPMLSELSRWLDIMRDGSTSPPRRRPRNPRGIYTQLAGIVPAAHLWAAAGHTSLRTITIDDLHAVLPQDPSGRVLTIRGLRSLFRILKEHRITFTNPAARLRAPTQQPIQPLPINIDPVREALDSDNPARAALAALLAFHAPRSRELRALLLTDVRDGRLHLPNRTVLLAAPAHARLRRWLDERARRWPNTSNPHLFISQHTAVRTTPITNVWINSTLGMPATQIRDDRILNEAIATRGDARRLSDLFGLDIASTARYTQAHNDDVDPASATFGPRTRGPA